jgi:hypothetical protein
MEERRKSVRVKVNFQVHWEGGVAARSGTIADLSTTGCFILSEDLVKPGELVRLEIQQPQGGVVVIWGQVVYQIEEMGFALNFTHADDDDWKRLGWIVKAEIYRHGSKP